MSGTPAPAGSASSPPRALTPFREAQAAGPTLLQAFLLLAVAGGATYLGGLRVLDAQAVVAIYVGIIGATTADVVRRGRARNDPNGGSE